MRGWQLVERLVIRQKSSAVSQGLGQLYILLGSAEIDAEDCRVEKPIERAGNENTVLPPKTVRLEILVHIFQGPIVTSLS